MILIKPLIIWAKDLWKSESNIHLEAEMVQAAKTFFFEELL